MADLRDSHDRQVADSRRRRRTRDAAWSVGSVGAITLLVIACGDMGPVFFTNSPIDSPYFSPSLKITSPFANFSVQPGSIFLISWTDSDPDSAAQISFDLIDTQTGGVFPIAGSISENDETDSWGASTDDVPDGEYHLRGRITDFIATTEVFAELDQPGGERVTVSIVIPTGTPANQPPSFNVIEPAFTVSVSQDDVLVVSIQPLEFEPSWGNPACGDSDDIPYDPDNEVEVQVFLDYDNSATNDDPLNTGPYELIFLTGATLAQCDSGIIQFDIVIDQDIVPVRPDGSPYWVRVIIADGVNPPVNDYADGTIYVVQPASD